MLSLKTLYPTNFKGFSFKFLLLACTLLTFSACDEGNLEDYYARPTCNMTDAEKETQKALDIEVIKNHFRTQNIDSSEFQTTPSGLHYKTLTAGSGDLIKLGDKIDVHYIGKFLNGSTFDSSYDRAKVLNMTVGAKQVIVGWEEAVQLMKVGEEARFYIPSYLAYGKCNNGGIPGNSVLMFDIKVVKKY